jgi:hypothetical protein
MEPLKTFHLFPQLPPELQNQIWQFYCEDRDDVVHCFSVDGDSVLYAACYYDRTTIISNTVLGDRFEPRVWGNSSDRVTELELHGNVSELCVGTDCAAVFRPTIEMIKKLPVDRRMRIVQKHRTSHVWVNFCRDLFMFDFCPDISPSPRFKPSWFRRFHQNCNGIIPRPLKDNHWLFNIQHLELRIPADHPEWYERDELDNRVIDKMVRLRMVNIFVDVTVFSGNKAWNRDNNYNVRGLLPVPMNALYWLSWHREADRLAQDWAYYIVAVRPLVVVHVRFSSWRS